MHLSCIGLPLLTSVSHLFRLWSQVGFDSLNEPSNGFLGRADLTSAEGLKNGVFTTGWVAIALMTTDDH